jgi:hypothetical protein
MRRNMIEASLKSLELRGGRIDHVMSDGADSVGRMSLRGFSTISFWADDVTAAVEWYAEFLGVDAYFTRPGPDGRLAYAEFRIGDLQMLAH